MFGAVKLNKKGDIDKYKYSGHGIGFDGRGTFWFPSVGFGCNVIIFGVDMSSSVHDDNKKKDILMVGESPKQGLDGTTLLQEKSIELILLRLERNFVWACIIMEQIVIYLSMIQKILNLKQKNLKLLQLHYD